MNINDEYEFLNLIVKNDYLHGKFLNTFSFLEYTGARKILKSQEEKDIDLDILNHMNEEIRHAQMFKKYALKVYPSKKWRFCAGDVFCYDLTRSLIGKLDRYCEELVGKSSCYHIVSYVIEKRALSFYKYYSKELKRNKLDISLRGLIIEEERHLEEMSHYIEGIIQADILDSIMAFEQVIFKEFFLQVSLEINEENINVNSSKSSICLGPQI